uniref:Uncharacterized protein n=1 Tax=Anguilla anguilla TaxID=7936 RepID=A0A0E9U383_ANGAN
MKQLLQILRNSHQKATISF